MFFQKVISEIFLERIKLLVEGVKVDNLEPIKNQNENINLFINETLKNSIIEHIEKNSKLKLLKNLNVYYSDKKILMDLVLVLSNNNAIYIKILLNKLDYEKKLRDEFLELKNSKYYFDNPFLKINFTDMMIITLDKNYLINSEQKNFIQNQIFNFIKNGSKFHFGNNHQDRRFYQTLKNNFFYFNKSKILLDKKLLYKQLKLIDTQKFISNLNIFNNLFFNNFMNNIKKHKILAPEVLFYEFNNKPLNLITYLVE